MAAAKKGYEKEPTTKAGMKADMAKDKAMFGDKKGGKK